MASNINNVPNALIGTGPSTMFYSACNNVINWAEGLDNFGQSQPLWPSVNRNK